MMRAMTPAIPTLSPATRTALGIAGLVAIGAIFVLERRRPLRRQTRNPAPRIVRNVAMGAMCAAVVATIETPVTHAIAERNVRGQRGLAQRAPRALRPLVAFLAMDYGFYLWHFATHRLRPLWRFHRVHHVDSDMDMSTAIRFHMADMLVSLPWRMAQVRLSGIGPQALDAWQRFFTLSILFHHSNMKLPGDWDRRLSWLITTPKMHGIHHSVVKSERDSNWSSGISLWDRLHGTMGPEVAQDDLTIGVDDPHAARDVRIEQALRAPFRASDSKHLQIEAKPDS